MRNTRNILMGIYAIGALVCLMIGFASFGFSAFTVIIFALMVMFLFIPASPKKYWPIFHSSAFTITVIAFLILGTQLIAGNDLWDSSMGWLTGKKTQTALMMDKDINVQYIWPGDPYMNLDDGKTISYSAEELIVKPTSRKKTFRGVVAREVVVGSKIVEESDTITFLNSYRIWVEPNKLHDRSFKESSPVKPAAASASSKTALHDRLDFNDGQSGNARVTWLQPGTYQFSEEVKYYLGASTVAQTSRKVTVDKLTMAMVQSPKPVVEIFKL